MMIEERHVLKPGTHLSLDGRKCIILGVMGAGTSCIAYKAQMKLTIKNQTTLRTIVLKELYPAHQNIIRETDNSLIIPDSSKAVFEEESESFFKAAILQFEFHNEENLTNFTSDIEVVYKLNNTLYSVTGIVSGKSYDKINPENITSILKVGESLSHAISYYHGRNYLNLDIKPSNIFYENLPGDNVAIKLFDFNTVCTKEEASEGRFSYSEGYAAPEVKAAKKGGGKLSEIGEQADIYSIGAVIFEKIMGRIPKVADQRAGKRWKLETNPYLKDVVPQLQNGITDLFRKTLAIDKKDRYSSAKELISDLENLIKLADIKVFLKNQRISPCTPKDIYISRKDVLAEISKRLDEKYVLYLHALGGSGKSETAREYAEQCTDKYDFIQSVFYSDSLKKTIANLDFVGLKDEDRFAHTDEDIDRLYKYKYGLLGNAALYGTNTLLIIDNYDYNVDPTSEEYQQNYKIIRELKKLNIHILFTTRVKPEDDTECLDLENMSEEELQTLFFRINPKDKNDPDRIEQVKEIIEVSYKHTMTVKLVAMQSAKYLKPLSEYIDILKTSGLNSGIKGRVTNEKDDESVTMSTVYDHIKALFDFERLSEKQRYIMVNACLLPLSGLETAVFSKYIDLEHFDGASDSDCLDESIEDLVNSGWIEYADTSEKRFTSETKITLHPLICDIVTNELKPELTEDKCRKFYISFLDLVSEWGNERIHKKNYHEKEALIYLLIKKMDELYENEALKKVFNQLYFCESEFIVEEYIDHYSLIRKFGDSENRLSIYFGIDENYVIPENITIIDGASFCYNQYPTNITITHNVTSISAYAFSRCNLKQIIISDSVEYIGDSAFQGCTSLDQVLIPDSVTFIGDSAFQGCTSLEQIIISRKINYIRTNTFSDCTALKKVVLPKNIEGIDTYAFWGCVSLFDINLPDSIGYVGNKAFLGCNSLPDKLKGKFPEASEKVHDNTHSTSHTKRRFPPVLPGERERVCYENINALIFLRKPDALIFLRKPDYVFLVYMLDENIKNIDNSFFISMKIKVILPYAFTDLRYLQHIEIPECVESIDHYAFDGCISLSEIKLPNSLINISNGTFKNCKKLDKIIIPDSVERIGTCAFSGCILTNCRIPASVLKIDLDAFDCKTLLKITLLNPEINLSISRIGYYTENGLYKKNNNLIIEGFRGSTAEQYAKEHGFKFVPLD